LRVNVANLLLAIAGSLAGAQSVRAVIQWFRLAHPVDMPPGARLEMSAAVFALTAFLGIVTTVVFGLAPAWNTSRIDLNLALKTLGRTASRSGGRQRFGKALILAELMLTVVLLAGAGMMIQTLVRFTSAPLGFRPEGLLTTSIHLRIPTTRGPRAAFSSIRASRMNSITLQASRALRSQPRSR